MTKQNTAATALIIAVFMMIFAYAHSQAADLRAAQSSDAVATQSHAAHLK